MPSARRHFLSQFGAASLAGLATPSLLSALPAPPPSPRFGTLDDHPAPITETWDMSWTARVSGKYRAVFDSPEIGEGGALVRAVAWCDMYKEVYGSERSEMSPVVVIRHAAIDLVMNDAYWATYEVGKENKLRNEKGKKWVTHNPLSAESRPEDEKARKYTLQSFIASGGIVLGCGWAFRFAASRIAKREKLEPAEARKRAVDQMIPGVILQPNGIFACLRAQEAGCHYVLAS